MELELTRETLRFERLVTQSEEQVTIEGEATLPGSMRDAVTVLSVQAQAHLNGAQAGAGEAAVRGRVCFQVLYTQGDLTRVRALETTCDFDHTIVMAGVTPQMRLSATASVQETEGMASSGRMTLRALLGVQVEAFETVDKELITGAANKTRAPSVPSVLSVPDMGDTSDADGSDASESPGGLQTLMQSVTFCISEALGSEKTLVREEFDLPAKLEVGDVLSATGTATVGEFTGGSGRVGVSGVIEVRVLHRPMEAGNPLVITTHELPYDLSIDAQLPDGAQPRAVAEVIDVMADSTATDKRRTLRVEAEVQVSLHLCRQKDAQLLEDLYSLSGPEIEPVTETFDVHTFEETADVRESARLQVTLPKDAPPIDTMLAAFVQPTVTSVSPSGRRLDAEGVMGVTLMYLPVDSDIPYAVHTREPFAMTFPVEASEGVSAQAYAIESTPGPTTSDRAEVRCVLGLRTTQHGVRRLTGITDVTMKPAGKQEHGFVLVWPAAGETRWATARRLRVAEDSLRPAGKNALLAFRK
ncbi:MAG: DUF3794 domain-containing protein [Clostridia bacterium]|nr:DUF3794 domain-containing protein [Clostridia bacterium]